MGEKYLLSVDGGTQSTKVLIFDTKGNVVCEGRKALRPMASPQVGFAEHPDDDLWDSLVEACKLAFERFPGDRKDIAGVGLCTIRCCRAYLKADGSLAYPVINWMDPRCDGPFSYPVPEKDFAYITTTTGYMTHRLTGKFKDTVANNINWQAPTDIRTWNWSTDDAVFEAFNAKRSQMLELCMPGDIVGYVTKAAAEATGIPEGIPVVATANDKAAEALGVGLMASNSNAGLISLGTYTTAMVKGDQLCATTNAHWPNFGCVPNRYTFEVATGVRRGMWMISWFANLFGEGLKHEAQAKGMSPLQLLNAEAAEVPACSDGLMTLAEWLGPTFARYRKGVIMGFDERHGRAHMFRSLMEGMVLMLYNRFTPMSEEVRVFPEKMIASGGGSKGDTFVQIISDVFALPVQRPAVGDAVGVACAICVATATGIYPDFDVAAREMVRVQDTFQPNMENHKRYMQMNDEVYRHINEATDPILQKSFPLFNK